MPTLAQAIVRDGSISTFKGFLLGNPLTDMDENMNWGQAGTLCGHALASRPTCDTFTEHCLSSSGPDSECTAAQQAVVNEAGALDAYGLDFPVCDANVEQKRLLTHLYKSKMHERGFSAKLKQQLATVPTPYDPCEMAEEATYLNRADVRAAIHASSSVSTWTSCSTVVSYNQTDVNTPMEPIYTELIARGDLQMLIFSGDDDSVCATLGTLHWTYNLLGDDVVEPWTQWTYESEEYGQQIGGSIVQFKGLSLATVHGAGHMVSGYRPEKGFAVLKNYLSGAFNTQQQQQKKKKSTKQRHIITEQ